MRGAKHLPCQESTIAEAAACLLLALALLACWHALLWLDQLVQNPCRAPVDRFANRNPLTSAVVLHDMKENTASLTKKYAELSREELGALVHRLCRTLEPLPGII